MNQGTRACLAYQALLVIKLMGAFGKRFSTLVTSLCGLPFLDSKTDFISVCKQCAKPLRYCLSESVYRLHLLESTFSKNSVFVCRSPQAAFKNEFGWMRRFTRKTKVIEKVVTALISTSPEDIGETWVG
jgi:hypothetical protein